MGATLEHKITFRQESKLTAVPGTFSSMVENQDLIDFAQRLNELCDEMGVPPKGQNRQAEVGRLFGVSQKGARRWLEAEGLPELRTCMRIAEWANVQLDWLMTGRGAKRASDWTEHNASQLFQVVSDLEEENRQLVFDFIRYRVERSEGLIARQESARYMKMIDGIIRDMNKRKGAPEQ